jgi:hypothetical protein
MLVIARAAGIARLVGAAVAVAALALSAGCSGDDDPKPDGSLISVTEMRGALLQAQEVGTNWSAPTRSADPNVLVSVCGGTTTAPPAPPGAQVLAAPRVEEGDAGAQTLNQTALVYADQTAAAAAFAGLRAVADGCQATVTVPRTVNAERSEPAYTEAVSTVQLKQNGWTGFAMIRHKQYEPKHPGTADTSVAILSRANVVLVETYAVYRLGAAAVDPSAGPAFTADWQRLVGTVVNRVG